MTNSDKSRNPVLYESIWRCVKAFVQALGDAPFVDEYGSWHDRVRVLVEPSPKLLAEILKLRPDLKKREKHLELARTLLNRCLEDLLNGPFSRAGSTPLHLKVIAMSLPSS